MVVNVNTEVRKLRPAELYNLGMILNLSDNWKKLMASVTKDGTDDSPKFPAEYISIVEQAAKQEHKLPAALFLEEWATMGKKRPTVGLLLDLLMKTQLFRAADYLAQDILKVAAPKRPSTGPAAAVDMNEITSLLLRQNLQRDSSPRDSNYCLRTTDIVPHSQIEDPTNVYDSRNEEISTGNEDGVIEIEFSKSTSNHVFDAVGEFNSENLDNYRKSSKELSDLMKFTDNSGDKSKLLSRYEKIDYNEESEAFIPNLSLLRINSTKFENNANYSLAENLDLASSELPEYVAKFGVTSVESPVVAEAHNSRSNLYFHQELSSAELPLCINHRTVNISSKIQSDDLLPVNNSSIISDESTEKSSAIYGDSVTEIYSYARDTDNNEKQNALDTGELPLTVLEFQK